MIPLSRQLDLFLCPNYLADHKVTILLLNRPKTMYFCPVCKDKPYLPNIDSSPMLSALLKVFLNKTPSMRLLEDLAKINKARKDNRRGNNP